MVFGVRQEQDALSFSQCCSGSSECTERVSERKSERMSETERESP